MWNRGHGNVYIVLKYIDMLSFFLKYTDTCLWNEVSGSLFKFNLNQLFPVDFIDLSPSLYHNARAENYSYHGKSMKRKTNA